MACTTEVASTAVSTLCAADQGGEQGAGHDLHPEPLTLTYTDSQNAEVSTTLVNQGSQIWLRSGSDWSKMGQIRDFFRSDFNTFWLGGPKSIGI